MPVHAAPSVNLRPKTWALLGLMAFALAACSSYQISIPGIDSNAQPAPAPPPAAGGATTGETMGSGPVRVGLLLPLTQGGAPSALGASLRNAAQLAVEESGLSDITLMALDDRSTPDGAAQAAQAALGAGAEILIGPLFAADVREAAKVARAAGRPVIALSTDASVSGKDVYLLSFLIERYVDRIVEYAETKGKKSFAVLAPQSDYGNIAAAEFQQIAAAHSLRVVTIARYSAGQPGAAVKEIAAAGNQIDALFIADQAEGLPAVSAALTANGVKTQILGAGDWSSAKSVKLAGLQGAWFSSAESAGFNSFAQRYRAKFNSDPARLATLPYDAVSLVAALARTQGAQRFSEKTLTNASGFTGADGVFRFRADGPNERGLAVLGIVNGAATVLSPAPRSFAGG